jgi:hypothetical protein
MMCEHCYKSIIPEEATYHPEMGEVWCADCTEQRDRDEAEAFDYDA